MRESICDWTPPLEDRFPHLDGQILDTVLKTYFSDFYFCIRCRFSGVPPFFYAISIFLILPEAVFLR